MNKRTLFFILVAVFLAVSLATSSLRNRKR